MYTLHVILKLFGRVGLDLVFLKANTACQRRSTGISSPIVVLTNFKVWMQNDSKCNKEWLLYGWTDGSKKQQKHVSLASTDEMVNNMYPAEAGDLHGRDGAQCNEAESNMNDVANLS